MGVREIDRSLEQWQLGVKDLRRRVILAPTPRERERWYAILLLAQGLTAAATAEALERDPHTIGRWASAFSEGGPAALIFEQTGGSPPALDQAQQEELKGAVEQPPATAGIVMANWYWKVVRQFVSERFGISRCRSSCLNWLYRLGFAGKHPQKRLLKANESKREAFVAEYAVLWEKASYYSAVCLETGEVEWLELAGNSNSGTSVAFLTQLKEKHPGPLRVIWDNAPAHRGEAVREYLRTPELELRLVNLPGYSPDFNADEAVWGWAREEVTGNLCLGSRAAVQERVGKFLAGLSSRKDEVRRRCRTVLQSRAETLPRDSRPDSQHPANAHPTLALV